MNSNIESNGQAKAIQPDKPLLTKGDKVSFLVFLIVELVLSGFWFQSRFFKYERSWSDPDKGECGRTLSADGRFLRQRCTIVTKEALRPTPADAKSNYDEVIAGSNAQGARTLIQLGSLPVSFAYPVAGQGFGFASESRSKGFPDKMGISYRWSESRPPVCDRSP